MLRSPLLRLFHAALWLLATCAATGSLRAETRLEVRAVEGLRFEPLRLRAAPGEEVVIAFDNADATDQPHNIVLCRPGSLKAVLDAALVLGADGATRDFVPATSDVLAASPLVKAGDRAEVRLTLPKEPGVHPFVCTFPGHGFVMFGALYVGTPPPAEKDDPNIPKPSAATAQEFAPDPRPMVRRTFLPDCGPAGLGIALPGDHNVCWDATTCRLRYAWQGSFLDCEAHFRSKGTPLAKLGGPVWWRSAQQAPLTIAGTDAKAAARFHGYELKAGLPVFDYMLGTVKVREGFAPAEGGFARRFEVTGATGAVTLALDPAEGVEVTPSAGRVEGGVLHLTETEATSFTVHYRRTR